MLEIRSPGPSTTLLSITSTVPRIRGRPSFSCIVGRVSSLSIISRSPPPKAVLMKLPPEQLQKMGFTTSSARGNGHDIFEPGPSRSLSSNMNSMIFCGNKNPGDQGNSNNTPAKKRGLLVGDRNMPSPVGGESGRFPSPKPTEVVIFVKPINVSLPQASYMTPIRANNSTDNQVEAQALAAGRYHHWSIDHVSRHQGPTLAG